MKKGVGTRRKFCVILLKRNISYSSHAKEIPRFTESMTEYLSSELNLIPRNYAISKYSAIFMQHSTQQQRNGCPLFNHSKLRFG